MYSEFKFSIKVNNSRMQPLHDVVNNIVMCASSREIKDVFVNGKPVLRDDEFVTIDEDQIVFEGVANINKMFTKAGFTDRIVSGEFS